MSLSRLRLAWFSNVRNDHLAGLVVALALIPEAIAFSLFASFDPKVGLYASFAIATVIAFVGGRPGMISAATGAVALVMVVLAKYHGLTYLLAATALTGILQLVAAWVRLVALMRLVSRTGAAVPPTICLGRSTAVGPGTQGMHAVRASRGERGRDIDTKAGKRWK